MLTPKDKAVLLRNLARAYNKRDALACAALFADKGSITLWDGTKLEGREQIEDFWRRVFISTPDAHMEILKVLTPNGETAVMEHMVEGTNLGPLTVLGREIAPTGKPSRNTMLGTYTFSPDGKFAAAKLIYNPYDRLRQLGVLKAPFVNEEIATAQVRKYIEALSNHDVESAATYLTEQVVIGSKVTGEHLGREYFKQNFRENFTAFPDARLTIKSIVADDNIVVATVQLKATHTGNIPNMKATGKPFETEMTGIYEVGPGGIFAMREYVNFVDIYTQLGIIKA